MSPYAITLRVQPARLLQAEEVRRWEKLVEELVDRDADPGMVRAVLAECTDTAGELRYPWELFLR